MCAIREGQRVTESQSPQWGNHSGFSTRQEQRPREPLYVHSLPASVTRNTTSERQGDHCKQLHTYPCNPPRIPRTVSITAGELNPSIASAPERTHQNSLTTAPVLRTQTLGEPRVMVNYKEPPDVISAEKLWCSPVAQGSMGVRCIRIVFLQNRRRVKARDWSPERPCAKKTRRTAYCPSELCAWWLPVTSSLEWGL